MSYFLFVYGKYLLYGSIAFLCFVSLICVVQLGGVSIRDITGVRYHLFRKKIWLYMMTVVYLVASILIMNIGVPRSCSAMLSFNYEGASSGLNPNKTRFNQADMLGSAVLKRMVDKRILPGVTEEDLRDVLYTTAEGSGGSIEDENYRVSSEYQIGYTANENTFDLNGENVLQIFAEVYREWFAEQYATDLTPLTVDYSTFNDEDYLDICDHLETEAKRIANFMSVMAMNTRSFQSEKTGEGFGSIETRADNICNTMVADLRAYILENSLSKDTQMYLGRLSAENVFLAFDAKKDRLDNENWLTAIKKYEDDMARIVLVPTYDNQGQFYMSQTKIGVDDFAEEAEENSNNMILFHADIANNNYVARQLSSGKSSDAAVQRANELIEQIEAELTATAERARALIQESEAKRANDYMTVTIRSWGSRSKAALKKAIMVSVAFFFMLHVTSFLFAMKKNRRKVS